MSDGCTRLLRKFLNVFKDSDEVATVLFFQELDVNNIDYNVLIHSNETELISKLKKVQDTLNSQKIDINKFLNIIREEKAYKTNPKWVNTGRPSVFGNVSCDKIYYYSFTQKKHYLITRTPHCSRILRFDLLNYTTQITHYPKQLTGEHWVNHMAYATLVMNKFNGDLYFVMEFLFVVVNIETFKWRCIDASKLNATFWEYNQYKSEKMRAILVANSLLFVNFKLIHRSIDNGFYALNTKNLPMFDDTSKLMYIQATSQLMLFGTCSNNDDIWISNINSNVSESVWQLSDIKLPFFKGQATSDMVYKLKREKSDIKYCVNFEFIVVFLVCHCEGADDYTLWFLDINDGQYCCSKVQDEYDYRACKFICNDFYFHVFAINEEHDIFRPDTESNCLNFHYMTHLKELMPLSFYERSKIKYCALVRQYVVNVQIKIDFWCNVPDSIVSQIAAFYTFFGS
eukprot:385004_1